MKTLRVPLNRLPSDPLKRHAILRDYFCDKDACAQAIGAEWHLQLFWPDGEDRHVDPRLNEGLNWWEGEISRSSMAVAKCRHGQILSTLYDTWTLYSWSNWLSRREAGKDGSVLILHVDDHKDLAPPRLFISYDQWTDPITGAKFNIADPASVQSSIESGAIGMGSFLTPFLHTFPLAEVRHLCQPPKANQTFDYKIQITTISDDFLEPGSSRPAITLKPITEEVGPGRYRMTPSTHDWLENTGSGPVLLHIDMDYFCNRFDGDSDWSTRKNSLNPDFNAIIAKIDEMVLALRKAGIGNRIEDVVIAYSPGFFPAEFWCPASNHLLPALKALYEL